MQVTGRRHYKLCFKSCRHAIILLQICFAYVGGSTRICFLILTVKTPIVEIMPLNGNRKQQQKSLFKNFFRLSLWLWKSGLWDLGNQMFYLFFFSGSCLCNWFTEQKVFGYVFPCFIDYHKYGMMYIVYWGRHPPLCRENKQFICFKAKMKRKSGHRSYIGALCKDSFPFWFLGNAIIYSI